MSYFVFEKGATEKKNFNGMDFEGYFKTMREAEAYVRKHSAQEWGVESGGMDEPIEEWGSEFLILELKKILKPIPKVSVSFKLKDITKETMER